MNSTAQRLYTSLALGSVLLFGCKAKDKGPKYYQDQELLGKINQEQQAIQHVSDRLASLSQDFYLSPSRTVPIHDVTERFMTEINTFPEHLEASPSRNHYEWGTEWPQAIVAEVANRDRDLIKREGLAAAPQVNSDLRKAYAYETEVHALYETPPLSDITAASIPIAQAQSVKMSQSADAVHIIPTSSGCKSNATAPQPATDESLQLLQSIYNEKESIVAILPATGSIDNEAASAKAASKVKSALKDFSHSADLDRVDQMPMSSPQCFRYKGRKNGYRDYCVQNFMVYYATGRIYQSDKHRFEMHDPAALKNMQKHLDAFRTLQHELASIPVPVHTYYPHPIHRPVP